MHKDETVVHSAAQCNGTAIIKKKSEGTYPLIGETHVLRADWLHISRDILWSVRREIKVKSRYTHLQSH